MAKAGDEDSNRGRAVAPAAAKQDLIGTALAPSMFAALLSRLFNWSRSGVGPRLLAAVLLFSSVVTLTLTALQLYLDYDREVGLIETRLDEIGRSTTGSLGESLWNLDQNQLKLQLDGILRLPDIRAAEVREVDDRPNPIRLAIGEPSTRSVVTRDYPLNTNVQGTAREIGVLHVEATLTDVYQHLLNRALVILASQAAKTFLVSLFIIYMFHLLVTRHLVAIADFVSKYSLARPPPPLRLERRPPYDADELDKVIDAFNAMCANLQRAYGELREANANLERDLKVRRRAEEDARASEERFRDYAETASDWFWETGPDHRFTYISDRAGAFSMDNKALIGKRRTDAASGCDAEPEKWRAHMAMLDRHEPFRKFEYRGRDTTGRMHHFSVNGQPVFAADGSFMGYRGSATDLTEQHETEERLRQSQKMDAIGQLTGGVAHDFNNVLTVITGTIEIIQEGLADKPEFAAIAQLIDDAAARGAEITSQLLTFARRQPLEPREIDVNALVIETAKLLRPILGAHIEIVTRLADDAWSAMADPSQLSSAIVNLAVNARDAMPGGGKLTIETANRELDDTDAAGDGDAMRGAFVMVAVADTGHGIPADIREHVFEPFFTTKGVGRGTGLGLSMVYGFAKQTGGTVAVESEEGRGTVMRLFLPRSKGEAPARTAPVQALDTARGHETILVVEDDPLVQGYVIARLGSLGYRTLVAGDGASALALVDQGAKFDLLFTDIIMPGGMNGRELADAIRLRRPGARVLYTSGYTDDAIVHGGHLDPGVALLRKPYRKSELSQKIREVLAGEPPD
ncbi:MULTISPECIES: ATP-binding protein [Bradyrhizobium]|jgi:PAS domain S-box-containing protein|uniref:histidine kinase n=3 Tax=Bradyrhizobium ottawaense TaxID=931866 RepID=A0A2U8PCU1_9BRAD|nr:MULTISPECIES: ATP-binding protein [Bradyrhizobium]AWL95380.1 hybrid sensor histidine kinase/response regulator [Bradyrhizobium ottawaense]MBR1291141.1 response regulator [Bradyrhizobium ottawaense]MBR1325016.1 response regulator [Bradyrhizobium ottawaense]MBR1333614.1 response regulator [Bradyrhizobium ottawaense]MDA9416065.1 ATPase [Bradyrhizobium sp. CCBAU 25360]